jgi:hypothetical protein
MVVGCRPTIRKTLTFVGINKRKNRNSWSGDEILAVQPPVLIGEPSLLPG